MEMTSLSVKTNRNSSLKKMPSYLYRVSRVIDGDTIEISIGKRTVKVRLIGIDAPETCHPNRPVEYYGPEAAAFAKKLLENQWGKLIFRQRGIWERDCYERVLARAIASKVPSGQYFSQIGVIPSGLEPFGLDADLGRLLLLEQTHGNLSQEGHIFWGMAGAYP